MPYKSPDSWVQSLIETEYIKTFYNITRLIVETYFICLEYQKYLEVKSTLSYWNTERKGKQNLSSLLGLR